MCQEVERRLELRFLVIGFQFLVVRRFGGVVRESVRVWGEIGGVGAGFGWMGALLWVGEGRRGVKGGGWGARGGFGCGFGRFWGRLGWFGGLGGGLRVGVYSGWPVGAGLLYILFVCALSVCAHYCGGCCGGGGQGWQLRADR